MKKDLPSPELLRKLLRYEPDTGKLLWLQRPREMFSSLRAYKTWNAQNANKLALNTNRRGYKCGAIFDTIYPAHRVCWALYYGKWPEQTIDHINGIKSDNKISNLRDVPHSKNCQAFRTFKSTRSNGQPPGVTIHKEKRNKPYRARIMIDGKCKSLGYFGCPDDAGKAYQKARVTLAEIQTETKENDT